MVTMAPVTYLAKGADRSGVIAVGGNAVPLAAAKIDRQSITGQNISSGDLWINETGGTAAIGSAGSFRVPPSFEFEVTTNQAVSVIGATAGQRWTATET